MQIDYNKKIELLIDYYKKVIEELNIMEKDQAESKKIELLKEHCEDSLKMLNRKNLNEIIINNMFEDLPIEFLDKKLPEEYIEDIQNKKAIKTINELLEFFNSTKYYIKGKGFTIKDIVEIVERKQPTSNELLALKKEMKLLYKRLPEVYEIKDKLQFQKIGKLNRKLYYEELKQLHTILENNKFAKMISYLNMAEMMRNISEIIKESNSNNSSRSILKEQTKGAKPQPKDIEKINKLLGFFQYLKFYKDLGNRGKIKKLKSRFKTIPINKMLKNKTSNISHKDNLLNEDNIQKDRKNLWNIKYILQLDIANSYVEDIEDYRNRLDAMYSKYENLRIWKKYLKYLSKIEKNKENIK